ncbi:MAG: hypothetical protein OXU74_04005 [Gemmatimonadota bacterium]|nr:hypothetical protein [Gemmatimonadota bacterium]
MLEPDRLPAAVTTVVITLLAACGEGATNPEQPNRPPAVVGELPAQVLAADGTVRLDASAYFSDPDGDALTYSALALDSSFVKIFVFGPEISLFGKNRGWPWLNETSITVAAMDPAGLSATQDMRVTVEAGDVGFHEDFDSLLSSNWRLTDALGRVEDGVLRLTSRSGSTGKARRQLNASMLEWEIRTRLTRARDSMTVRIVANTTESVIRALALDIGPGVLVDGNATNYRVLFLHSAGGWLAAGAGNHRTFDTAGPAVNVGLVLGHGQMSVTLDGQSIHTEPGVDFGLAGVELWVVPLDGAADRQALFEWVQVAGVVQ